MNRDTIFAVVDLETTGNSIKNDDRIIQFGCTLIQHDRIIDNFSSNVNAQLPIPTRITQLTGISDADIEDAPTWQQLAAKIKKLLSNTVFVAHNVNFDFPFLNHELERVGVTPLQIQAIDTVTLSQILMPNLPSYRLRDLTQYFNIDHRHPHAAISDAHATAQLFLLLVHRLYSLPPKTLKMILKLQVQLPHNTLDLFKIALTHNSHQNKLDDHLQSINGMIIRKQPSIERHHHLNLNLDRHDFEWFFNNFSQPFKFQQNLLIELPLSNDRIIMTLKLMLSLASQRRQQLVVSVFDDYFAHRLLEQALPVLQQSDTNLTFNQFIPFDHLIDLNRFKITLAEPIRSNQIQMLKARILVWLTITKNGNLNELAIEHQPYLDEIRYLKIPEVDEEQPDFWQLQLKMRKHSDVIITNHHYLYQHYHFNKKPYLLVYNPLKLPSVALDESRSTIVLRRINTLIRQLRSKILNSHQLSLDDLLPNSVTNSLMNNLERIDEHMTIIQQAFAKRFLGKRDLRGSEGHYHRSVALDSLKSFKNQYYHDWQKLHRGYQALISLSEAEVANKMSQTTIQQRYLFNDYDTQLTLLKREIDQFIQMSQTISSGDENDYFQIEVNTPHDLNTCQITSGLHQLQKRLKNRIYRFFQPVVMVTSTRSNTKEGQYLIEQLTLGDRTHIQHFNDVKIIRSLHILDDNKVLNNVETFINEFTNAFSYHHCKTLLIVDSQNLIHLIYHEWAKRNFTNEFNVFAEQVNASDNKLYKNLLNDEEVIGMVSPEMIDDYPELLKNVDLVVFIGHYQSDYDRLWFQQNLSLLNTDSYVGLINLSKDIEWSLNLSDAGQQWHLLNEDYFHFSLGINNFLLNLKKGSAR